MNKEISLDDYKGTSIEKAFNNDLEKAKSVPIGTINKYNEIKTADGWKYIKKADQKAKSTDSKTEKPPVKKLSQNAESAELWAKKYLDKYKSDEFEANNNIKQGEKQLAEKQRVQDNYFDNALKFSARLTKDEYESLENMGYLEVPYDELPIDKEAKKEKIQDTVDKVTGSKSEKYTIPTFKRLFAGEYLAVGEYKGRKYEIQITEQGGSGFSWTAYLGNELVGGDGKYPLRDIRNNDLSYFLD